MYDQRTVKFSHSYVFCIKIISIIFDGQCYSLYNKAIEIGGRIHTYTLSRESPVKNKHIVLATRTKACFRTLQRTAPENQMGKLPVT